MKSKQTKATNNNMIDISTPALLVTNKVMPGLGLVHHTIGADSEAISPVPIISLVILSCEFERIKTSSFAKTTLLSTYKSYDSWTNESIVDLTKPTIELQSIGI